MGAEPPVELETDPKIILDTLISEVVDVPTRAALEQMAEILGNHEHGTPKVTLETVHYMVESAINEYADHIHPPPPEPEPEPGPRPNVDTTGMSAHEARAARRKRS